MKKKIKDLIVGLENIEIKGDKNLVLNGVTHDSRKVKEGFLFIAIKGLKTDGHDFIGNAIEKGAKAILCESWPQIMASHISWLRHDDNRKCLSVIADNYFDHPSESMNVIGVTGTNGKTTVATLLYDLFKELGWKVGLISTIEIRVGEKKWNASLTTPDAWALNALLHEMYMHGCQSVFMEVSSHALDQHRVSSTKFKAGVFTNISHDHLDYHGTMKEYIRTKKTFFDDLGTGSFAIINADDKNARTMVQNTRAEVFRYSLRNLVDFKGKILSSDKSGLFLEFEGVKLMSRLIGNFNAYNLLAVYSVARLIEAGSQQEIIEKLSGLKPVSGRFELVSNDPKVVIDYAHTPDALENVLQTMQRIKGGGQLITVVGCGGDRDRTKRPIMGRIAFQLSDQTIFTSDNPRSEDPSAIIEEMKGELNSKEKSLVLEMADRRTAIKMALRLCGKDDVILIAGKGHESYQEIKGKKHFFSDKQIVKEILSEDI